MYIILSFGMGPRPLGPPPRAAPVDDNDDNDQIQ